MHQYNRIYQFLMAISLAFFTSFVHASHYINGSISRLDASNTSVNDLSLTSISVKFGKTLTEQTSGEVRLGLGVSGSTVPEPNGSHYNVDIESFYGTYLKTGLAIDEATYAYVILGLTEANLDAKKFSSTESDFSFGIGIDLGNRKDIFFNLEYMRYISKNSVELNGFNFGLTKYF